MNEVRNGQDRSIRLAFFDYDEFDGAIRGGALVTDADTTPIEFRCTAPIRPSSIQRVLYGGQLDDHLAVELIGLPILKALREKPTLILACKPSFLNLRPRSDLPVVTVFTMASASEAGLTDEDVGKGTITSDDGSFEPVVVKAHARWPDDGIEARRLLIPLLSRHRIVEPFERVRNALGLVHDSKQQ